jgi:hypothetical protein
VVGNLVRAGARRLLSAAWATSAVCSVSFSTPPAVTATTSPCLIELAVRSAVAASSAESEPYSPDHKTLL